MATKAAERPSGPAMPDPGAANCISKANKNGPVHRFQLNHHLLYERDFGGDTYVSAHLQRLQNGCFTHKNILSKRLQYVTFVAMTFTFHPSISQDHRFKSAVINITAKTTSGQPIRFLKFAPHLAFGRISSETLKWNFKLGATVGISQGPIKADVEPSAGLEKDKVVGTMMKIQGSTRSTRAEDWGPPLSSHNPEMILPDTKVVWSLEENTQQESGLPREFTFVFLMERIQSPRIFSDSSFAIGKPLHTESISSRTDSTVFTEATLVNRYQDSTVSEAPSLSDPQETSPAITKDGTPYEHLVSMLHHGLSHAHQPREKGQTPECGSTPNVDGPGLEAFQHPTLGVANLPFEVLSGPDQAVTDAVSIRRRCSNFSARNDNPFPGKKAPVSPYQVIGANTKPSTSDSTDAPTLAPPDESYQLAIDDVDGAGDKQWKPFAAYENEVAVYNDDVGRKIMGTVSDSNAIFTPIHFHISVTPRINGSLDKKLFSQYSQSVVQGEVGQRFPTALGDDDGLEGEHPEVMVNDLYNFAHLPGDWEDLVELPGNTVTSVEPTLT